ncbi:uncharacterized protein LOC113315754 [Papaver somniferum]|uniref:uncharacterized protein LOC113315754 n=1 Tax=Papaver somniferum TaxID=3469 RepID=UPI000E6F895B|nr:uncharacterized protein LOC113315754 [Papaver somniferum]
MSPGNIYAAKLGSVNNSKNMLNIDDELFFVAYLNIKTHPGHKITLLTGSENEEAAPSVSPERVMRFCLQKKEYRASPIDFKIFHNPLRSYEGWMRHMLSNERIKNNLTKAQVIEVVMASATLHIRKDFVGLITFVSRWCPSTHTTIYRWGEMTITLESVAVFLSLPVAGNLDVKLSAEEEVMDVLDDGSGKKVIRRKLVMFSIKLAQGVVLPLGSLFLGSLYSHLDSSQQTCMFPTKVESRVHISFIQACLWEQFKGYAPVPASSFSSLYGGSRILRRHKRRPKPELNLIDFFDSVYAIDFRPWEPVHSYVVQPKTFAADPDIALSTDGADMSFEEIIFMQSCMPGYIPSFFNGSFIVVSYNIDRAALHMGFDQGIRFDRPLKPSAELLQSVLNASLFATKMSLPFWILRRKPVATDKYKEFWRE